MIQPLAIPITSYREKYDTVNWYNTYIGNHLSSQKIARRDIVVQLYIKTPRCVNVLSNVPKVNNN